MVTNIPVIAVLLIVQGIMEALMGVLYVAMGPAMFALLKFAPPPSSSAGGGPPPDAVFGILSAVYIVIGVLVLVAGGLKIFAGVKNMKFRSRTLGIVALSSGALTILSCYCLPTALALMVFGLVVYLNDESTRAFQMGEEGTPPDEIKAAFLKR